MLSCQALLIFVEHVCARGVSLDSQALLMHNHRRCTNLKVREIMQGAWANTPQYKSCEDYSLWSSSTWSRSGSSVSLWRKIWGSEFLLSEPSCLVAAVLQWSLRITYSGQKGNAYALTIGYMATLCIMQYIHISPLKSSSPRAFFCMHCSTCTNTYYALFTLYIIVHRLSMKLIY